MRAHHMHTAQLKIYDQKSWSVKRVSVWSLESVSPVLVCRSSVLAPARITVSFAHRGPVCILLWLFCWWRLLNQKDFALRYWLLAIASAVGIGCDVTSQELFVPCCRKLARKMTEWRKRSILPPAKAFDAPIDSEFPTRLMRPGQVFKVAIVHADERLCQSGHTRNLRSLWAIALTKSLWAIYKWT